MAPWITYNSGVLQIYFCVVFCETRHHAQATLHFAHLTMPFLQPRAEQTWQRLILLASGGYGSC
jgi:hypothetical protein